MDAWSYFEEQRRQFQHLAEQFQENSQRYQNWQHYYVKHLHRHLHQRFVQIPAPKAILVEEADTHPTVTKMASTDISDEQWQAIAPLLVRRKHPGRPNADARSTLNGILYVQLHRCPWRAMPPHYGNFVTCWRRLLQWQNDGTWERMLPFLPPQLRPPRILIPALNMHRRPAAS